MLTMFMKKKEQIKYDKYYNIGYNAYFNKVPRELADDLVLTDRASFMKGWDMAEKETLNKSPRTPRPSLGE